MQGDLPNQKSKKRESTMFMFHAIVSQRSRETRRVQLGRTELGQATAEYALVILGAAAVAGLALAWAAGSGKIGRLLDAVLNSVIGQVG